MREDGWKEREREKEGRHASGGERENAISREVGQINSISVIA